MSTVTETTMKSSAHAPVSCVLLDYDFEIPMDIRTLSEFRQWAHSSEFPKFGRIDFLPGRIEVDMSPEDFYTHGTPKYQIGRLIGNWIDERDLGHIVSDSTRISSPKAELSAEPDLAFIAYETMESGRARLIPSATGTPDSGIEVEGAVDLVVEFISNSSFAGELPALAPGIVGSRSICYDMAYGRDETPFLRWAHQRGVARAVDGLGMLVEQAAESFYLWRGLRPDTASVLSALSVDLRS
jgi:hypothetical protein